jgi:hypothetical protein
LNRPYEVPADGARWRGVVVRFGGIAPASESVGTKQAPDHFVEAGAIVGSALGAPSAGLSLGRLLASRAHLRFTRRHEPTTPRLSG